MLVTKETIMAIFIKTDTDDALLDALSLSSNEMQLTPFDCEAASEKNNAKCSRNTIH